MRQLVIGGVTVPLLAGLEITQSYEPVEAVYRMRLASGALIQRTAWSGKLRTQIDARGAIPPGLQSLSYGSAITVACVQHRAITGTGTSYTLPAARRSDSGSLPYGRALVAGAWVPTTCNVVGNVATLGTVAGATQYQAVYFPSLSCLLSPPVENRDADGGMFGWSLTGEEV